MSKSQHLFEATFNDAYQDFDSILEAVAKIAAAAGLDKAALFQIDGAAAEAVANIVQHAYRGLEGARVKLEIEQDESGLQVILTDWGKPFDPSQVPEIDVRAQLAAGKRGGLGLYMMRRFVDRVEYGTNPDGSNFVRLTKALPLA